MGCGEPLAAPSTTSMRVRVSIEMEVPDVDRRLSSTDRDDQLVRLVGEVLFCGDAPVGALGSQGNRLRKSECMVEVVVG